MNFQFKKLILNFSSNLFKHFFSIQDLLRSFTKFYFRDKLISDNDTPESMGMKKLDLIKVFKAFDYPDLDGTKIIEEIPRHSLKQSETKHVLIDLSEDSGFFGQNSLSSSFPSKRKFENDSKKYETIDLSLDSYPSNSGSQSYLNGNMDTLDMGNKALRDFNGQFIRKREPLTNIDTNKVIKGFENRIDYGLEKLRSNLLSDSQDSIIIDETVYSDPYPSGSLSNKRVSLKSKPVTSTPKGFSHSQPGTSKSFSYSNAQSEINLFFDKNGSIKSFKIKRDSTLGYEMELYCNDSVS